MEIKNYCTSCKKVTEHIPKLSAVLSGNLVCSKCSKMNGFCILKKIDNDSFEKHSKKVLWIEFGDDNRFKEQHETAGINRSLIMSPFNEFFTWQTTVVTEILELREDYVRFNTKNSQYELYLNNYLQNKEENEENDSKTQNPTPENKKQNQIIISTLSNQLGCDKEDVKPNTKLEKDLGMDNIDRLEIVMLLEKEFNITIDSGEEEEFKTVE
jgi:acyl carrier protein